MRRITVPLDDSLDAGLARAAAGLGVSKAELIRRAAREWLDREAEIDPADAWTAFTGAGHDISPDGRTYDEVIYGSAFRRPEPSHR